MTVPAAQPWPPPYDVVMPVGPGRHRLARIAARELRRHLPFRRLFLVAGEQVRGEARSWGWDWLVPVDEDRAVEGLSFASVAARVPRMQNVTRGPGHYLQQFLKMGMARHPGILDHYLIWDADTVPLRRIEFFTPDGRILIAQADKLAVKRGCDTVKRLIGLELHGSRSLVCEHMMVRTAWMREVLEEIERHGPPGQPWPERVLSQIAPEDVEHSGFSEYQTYGHWARLKHGEEVELRELKSTRRGGEFFGMHPNRYDLDWLARRYEYASFELWKVGSRREILRNKARAFRKGVFGRSREQ